MRAAIAALMLAVACGPAAGQANMAGLGTTACAEARPHFPDKRFRVALLAWATGFYTGVNMAAVVRKEGFRNLTGITEDSVVGAVERFCAANPGSLIIAAVERMYSELPAAE